MAKKRRAAHLVPYQFRPAAAPRAQIIRVSAPRAPAKRKRGHRRSSSMFGGSGNGLFGDLPSYAVGGAAYGFAVKQGWVDKLPAIPLLGRTGSAALAFRYAAKHGGGDICRKASIAAAVLAGYQLGHDGHVTGLDVTGMTTTGDDQG